MKKIVVIVITVLCLVALIGGLSMRKKIVKQEEFDIKDVNNIILTADKADSHISITDNDKLKVTQYSMKKVDGTFRYSTEMNKDEFTIKDNSKPVNWFFIKGSAGVSYEVEIPKTYVQSIDMRIENGNMKLSASDNHMFKDVNLEVGERGNINLSNLGLEEHSKVSTDDGNIDITLTEQTNCKAVGKTGSGNVKVDDRFSEGKFELILYSGRGNITVK